MKISWERFWIGVFEYLLIRPIIRSTGLYIVTVEEYDCEMTAPFCYTWTGFDKIIPYQYKFDRYIDALNTFNRLSDHRNNIVPTDSVRLEYIHKKVGTKKLIEMKW